MNGSEAALLTIGGLARAVTARSKIRCTPRMIRNYEDRGVIPPPARSPGGVRLYSDEYVISVLRIKTLQRDYGLSLSAIKRMLEEGSAPGPSLSAGGTGLDSSAHRRNTPAGEEASRAEGLVRAADRVLRAKGYREATVDDIVREAGVAKGTFYLYFHSKQDVFLEVLERAVQALEHKLSEAMEGTTGPLDRLEQRALAYMSGYLNYRDLIHILYGEAVGGNERFQGEFRRIYEKITSTLAGDLTAVTSVLPGEALDPELLSYALVGAGEMLAYRSTLDDRYDLETIVSRAMDVLRGAGSSGWATDEPVIM
jgi:AcrR family transcriptional regulator